MKKISFCKTSDYPMYKKKKTIVLNMLCCMVLNINIK